MTRRLPMLLLVVVLTAAACGTDAPVTSEPPTSVGAETVSTAEYLMFRDQPVACEAQVPIPAYAQSYSEPDAMGVRDTATAIIRTSCGDITIALDAGAAPLTVNSFVFLAEQGYFDGTVSHRVVPGFMIQMGDPTATGRGGPGYLLPDELPRTGFIYTRGTVAMANAGANTGGSQFFMMLADAALPPAYSVFGTITEGIEVLDLMAQVPTVARSTGAEPSSPTETIYIESIDITR